METLNSLARELYISGRVTESGIADVKRYRGRWSSHVLKNDLNTLRLYHEKARELTEPSLDSCVTVKSSEGQVRQALDISVHPLAWFEGRA